MSIHITIIRRLYRIGKTLTVALIMLLSASCVPQSQPASVSSTALAPTATSEASSTSSPDIDATKQAGLQEMNNNYATRVAALAPTTTAIMQTEVALDLTPENLRPTNTLYPVEPTPTLQMGIIVPEQPSSYRDYYISSMWRGTVDGVLGGVLLAWGLSYKNSEAHHGVIIVYKGRYETDNLSANQMYDIPTQADMMIITSVSGTRLMLTEATVPPDAYIPQPVVGGQTLIFDLATRQFVSP